MEYLIGGFLITALTIGYMMWDAARIEKMRYVPVQFDEKKYNRLQKDADKTLKKMWALAGGRPE